MSEVIDREALRRKYREERDKRLRPDGNEQYLQPTGRFAHLLDDPYVERVPREPLFDEVTVACIGGGFAGLATGAALVQAGVDDVRIVEKGGDVGGAWYWNRYPGAMCDTAAMIYLPLLEETGHRPSQKYTKAPEILEHCQRIAAPLRALRQRLLLDGGDGAALGRRRGALDHPHRPRRRDARQVRHRRPRAAAPTEAARHPRHRELRRAHVPHQPVGLRLHRRRPQRRPHGEARRQARRHHRHRRHRGAVHPAPGPGRG